MSECGDGRQNNEKSEHPAVFNATASSKKSANSYIVNEDTAIAVSLSVYGNIILQGRAICIFRDAVLHERLQALSKIKPPSAAAFYAAG